MEHGRLFIVAAVVLSCCPGIFGDSKLKIVLAFTGESVVLPCIANIMEYTTTVEWSKVGMDQHVLVFRQGCEIHREKHPAFRFRSSLFMDELKNRNVSVRISDVKLSDAGNYMCKTIHKQIQRSVIIELIVGAVSEPKLSVVPSTDAGVTLQCEAKCWSPKPDITFLDDAGKEISAHDEKTEHRPGECYNVTRRVTVQTATNSVTCKVNEQHLNQSKVATFVIPDVCLTSCTNAIIMTAAIIVFVCSLILCLAFFYVKYKDGHKQRPSACAACWSSEENQAAEDDAANDSRSPDQHPVSKEEVTQPQTEQPNEVNSRLSPSVGNGNISGSSQAVAQGLSTERDHVASPSGNRNDTHLDDSSATLPSPNNTKALRRYTISGLSIRSSSLSKRSEEAVTLLPP